MILGRDSLGASVLGAAAGADAPVPETPIALPAAIGDPSIRAVVWRNALLTLPPAVGSCAMQVEAQRVAAFLLPPVVGGFFARAATRPPWADAFPPGVVLFTCSLSGALAGLPDVTLPISSFSVRHRPDGTSFFQVVVPTAAPAPAIAARRAGTVTLTALAAGVSAVVFAGALTDVSLAVGARSESITLQGNYTRPAEDLKAVALSDVISYQQYEDGRVTVRTAPQPSLRPGDAIYFRGQFLTVAELAWSVSASASGITASMDITVAPA